MNNNCPNASNLKDSLAVVNLLGCFNCHLQSSPVRFPSSVSIADVCILSPLQTKINTFTDKDIEVFPKTCVSPMKTQGKKIVVFLARWLFARRFGSNRRKQTPKSDHVGRFLRTPKRR